MFQKKTPDSGTRLRKRVPNYPASMLSSENQPIAINIKISTLLTHIRIENERFLFFVIYSCFILNFVL